MISSSSIAYHDNTSIPKTWNPYQSKVSIAQWSERRFDNLEAPVRSPVNAKSPFVECPNFASGVARARSILTFDLYRIMVLGILVLSWYATRVCLNY